MSGQWGYDNKPVFARSRGADRVRRREVCADQCRGRSASSTKRHTQSRVHPGAKNRGVLAHAPTTAQEDSREKLLSSFGTCVPSKAIMLRFKRESCVDGPGAP